MIINYSKNNCRNLCENCGSWSYKKQSPECVHYCCPVTGKDVKVYYKNGKVVKREVS